MRTSILLALAALALVGCQLTPEERALRETVEESPDEILARGSWLEGVGELAGAERAYSKVLALQPDHVGALVGARAFGPAMLGLHLVGHRYEEGMSELLDAIELLSLAGQGEGALTALDELLAANRSAEQRAQYLHLDALHSLGRDQQVADEYTRLLGDHSLQGWPDVHLLGGRALRGLGRLEEAVRAYRRSVAASPRELRGHFGLGGTLNELGDYEQALAAYTVLAEISPEDAEAHNDRALQMLELGRFEEALAAHERAIALDDEHPNAHFNRGLVLSSLGRDAEAVHAYDRSIELQPDNSETHYNRGNSLYADDREEEAALAYARAAELDPEMLNAHYNLGVALEGLGRSEEALRAFERASALAPEDPDLHFCRGEVLEQLDRRAEALESFEQALLLASAEASYAEAVERLAPE